LSSAWLEVTEEYEWPRTRRRHRDRPVAIDGVVRDGQTVRRATTGHRKRWLVAPGTHTLRVGRGWMLSPAVEFTVADGETARFKCRPRPMPPYTEPDSGVELFVWPSRLLAHVFGHDRWITLEQVSRPPRLQDWSIRPSGADTSAPRPPRHLPKARRIRELQLPSSVAAVAFSPDGQLLATAGSGKTARLWQVPSGELVRTLPGHTGVVYAVAFSPDGQLLATAGGDRTARLWQVPSGELLRTLPGHTGWVSTVAFSPDGQLLATAGTDRTALLWKVSSGEPLRTLSGHTRAVNDVAFSPDCLLLATAGSDRTARLWALTGPAAGVWRPR